MNFKDYINTHFISCHEIAATYSENYHRVVRLFYIPGFYDVVGISDGVDAWVATATADVMGINVARTLQRIFDTDVIPYPRHHYVD